jgi:hypothetical protein
LHRQRPSGPNPGDQLMQNAGETSNNHAETSCSQRNIGFDGRVFLTASEWQTYIRRKPVRYVRRAKAQICAVCGEPAGVDNPLQNAHVIAFDMGVIELALTPEFLDSATNIFTAHRRACNRAAELDVGGAVAYLRRLGIAEVPGFLSPSIKAICRQHG